MRPYRLFAAQVAPVQRFPVVVRRVWPPPDWVASLRVLFVSVGGVKSAAWRVGPGAMTRAQPSRAALCAVVLLALRLSGTRLAHVPDARCQMV